ncbi:PREDICTED: uncharacterized protein LOC106541326 [Thamnophis sirtalis]|uniref:Uncharacterized protein LOC106541326 n=1 Tax=Thamnophis sirtalis TaxID=35019 RepID=A0A6I9XN70_9SAUR|nr:PREDICTED: uncharacterized protein LOC106541326 [Thamnophis sirtalis]
MVTENVLLIFPGNNCNVKRWPGSNIPEKNPINSQTEKVRNNFISNKCSNEPKKENNLYCSVIGSALKFWKLHASDGHTETTLKGSVTSFENLFDNRSHWDSNTKKDFVTMLPMIMEDISLGALFTALANPGNISQTVVRNFTDFVFKYILTLLIGPVPPDFKQASKVFTILHNHMNSSIIAQFYYTDDLFVSSFYKMIKLFLRKI